MIVAKKKQRSGGLSKARIVEAAIAILDNEGEAALTFRALAKHLATGAGAIYWHVLDKKELLAAATDEVITRVVTQARGSDARQAIRSIALGIFDAIAAHPWVGTELAREPWQPAMGLVLERFGGHLETLGVAPRAQFDAASALQGFILGTAAQHAAAARLLPGETDRAAFMDGIVERWTLSDPEGFPFVRRIAKQLRTHDDRKQFLFGIDLILTGITTS